MSILDELAAQGDKWLTSGEVADLFRVDPKTVMRWGGTGKLPAIRTPGGREFRFHERHVRAALEAPAAIESTEAVA